MSPYPADPEWARGPMRLVLTTYPSRSAALAAVAGAVDRRLAACGSLVPIESRFVWRGAVETQAEALVIFKTVPKRVGALFRFLETGHPYDVPEIVELDVPRVAPGYLAYLADALDRSSGPLAAELVRRRAGRPARGARGPARTRARPRPRSKRTGTRR
ncbi:MAG TPA: divalent-cation tolerance protein CutA [Thermoplasmata archaeon]|nr:divalent-cation tolerance protein CutA [Thermoplasmata archaeon]